MARWSGKVGFVDEVETPAGSGIYKPTTTELSHRGEVLRESKKFQGGYSVNDDLYVTNRISIVASQYAVDNAHKIKYVEFGNAKYKVVSYNIERPRIVLTLGGVWNG